MIVGWLNEIKNAIEILGQFVIFVFVHDFDCSQTMNVSGFQEFELF